MGSFEDLKRQDMWVKSTNFIKLPSLDKPIEAITRIRYKDPGTLSTLEQIGDYVKVSFHKPVSAVAPGQSAVFYDGADVIGGGFIAKHAPHEIQYTCFLKGFIFSDLLFFTYFLCKKETIITCFTFIQLFSCRIGRWVEYDVDSIYHGENDNNNDDSVYTFHFQIREEIDSTFINGQGQETQILIRYKRRQ